MRLKAAAGNAERPGSTPDKPGETPGPRLEHGNVHADAFNRPTPAGPDRDGDLAANARIDSGRPAGDPVSFADNLAARIRDGGAMDIVRSAQIVLKDGDVGLIRLRLEPESLGGVKIELKMAEKQISARIVVESDLAGEAFRSSLDTLRDAFAASGFETSALEVEVQDRGNHGFGKPDDTGTRPDGMARHADEFSAAIPSADLAYGRYSVIDLVV
jgi:hypothetical protein